jgi:ech hydrogenase subunit E
MGTRTIVPFGPQHPVLPEPIHLDLVLEDEKVVEAIPTIGFVHRGFEKLVEKMDFNELVYVADRICGICAFIHSLAYCQALEAVLAVEVPPRAVALRTIWSELARLSSHLLWMGLMADAFGFESLFMQCFRLREAVVDIMEETTGGRIILGVCRIGGVRRDIEDTTLAGIVVRVNGLAGLMREAGGVFLRDASVEHRLRGVGVIPADEAYALGCVGPVLRASGIRQDTRLSGYAGYAGVQFEPVVRSEGDCYARCAVRIEELFQAVDIVNQVAAKVPPGEVAVKVSGYPDGEYFSRCEQPRGEVIHYVKADGTRYLQRYRVRTPTFANIPALVRMLQGCDLADVPVLILTIDPCISCTER